MIGRTNVGGGGVGGTAFAYIRVAYPVGGTVSCTDGRKTFVAKDTSGVYVFGVPYAATWTLTATIGGATASNTVTITDMYQVESIVLATWDGIVFNNGDQKTAITGGWYANGNMTYSNKTARSDGSVTSTAIHLIIANTTQSSFITTRNKVNVSGFSKMAYTIGAYQKSSGSQTNNIRTILALSSAASGDVNDIINYSTYWQSVNSTGEVSGDLSGATGSYFVSIGLTSAGGHAITGTVDITNVRFFNSN